MFLILKYTISIEKNFQKKYVITIYYFLIPFIILFRSSRLISLKNTSSKPQRILQTKFKFQKQLSLQFYASTQKYSLNAFNSIVIHDGKIFDLLTDTISKIKSTKSIKCNCTNSKCGNKYCECVKRGNKCGHDCGCTNCYNVQTVNRQISESVFKGCKCQKSLCLQDYCECHKQHLLCNKNCRCINCKNFISNGQISQNQYSNLVLQQKAI